MNDDDKFVLYLKSAEDGDSNGQNNLGFCYLNGIGTARDENKAFEWYLKLAEGGNSNEQDNLGFCYKNGIGTDKDKKKAFKWYLKSAEGGIRMDKLILDSAIKMELALLRMKRRHLNII